MNFNDDFFKKVEKKTKVNKKTILDLAEKLNNGKVEFLCLKADTKI